MVKAAQLAGAKVNSEPSLQWLVDEVMVRGRTRAELHIDVLHPRGRDRMRWLESATELFNQLCQLSVERGRPWTSALQMFLRSGSTPSSRAFNTPSELDGQLSWTPPSIIVYDLGHEPWVEGAPFVQLSSGPFYDLPPDSRLLFQEWFDQEEQDFDRRLWVVLDGKPTTRP